MAFRSSTGLTGGTGTTAAFTVPAGAVSGDIGVVVLYMETTATVSGPDGTWAEDLPALIANEGAGSGRMRRFYSRSPALSGTWTFSWTGSAWRSGAAALISGRTGTGNPFGTASTFEAAATSNFTVPAVTASAGDDLLALITQNSVKAITPPSGIVNRQDNDEVFIGTTDSLSGGSTGTKNFVSNAGGDVHAWMAPVLLSASGAAAPVDTAWVPLRPGFKVGSAFPAFMRAFDGPFSTDVVVSSGLTQVTSTRATTWNTKAQVTSTRATTWAVNGPTWFTAIGTTTPEFVVSSEDWALLSNGAVHPNGTNYQKTFDDYFTTRAAQGYNAIETSMFHITDYDGAQNGPDGDNVYPFNTNSLDPLNARNTAWWDRRDYFFASAASHGFRVFLNISTAYLGLGAFAASWTTAQWTAWGNHLAAKYPSGGSYDHVFWIVGDDYFFTVDTGLNALLTAMRAGGCNQPISIQWYQEATSRQDIFTGSTSAGAGNNWSTGAQYNWGYSYNASYDVVEKMGNEANPIPYGWMDGFFLNAGTTGITDKQLMRRMVWWGLSSGAKSVQIGNNNVYPWGSGAYTEVTTNTFYTSTIGNIVSYFKNLPNWWELKADTSNVLVTAGRGTHASAITSGGSGTGVTDNSDSYVSASWIQSGTNAGKLAVIYMSHGSTITIDQTKMVASYTATWVDPKSGATSSATPGATYNSTAKGTNSDGEADWVLVLKAPSSLTQVTSTRATSWDTLAQVSSTRATTFDTLARVTATRATTWDTLAAVTSTRATTFDTLAAVTSSRATSWDTLARVTASRATTWDVLSTVATSTRATTWDTLAAVTSTRATTWRTLAAVTSTRATSWDTLARVTSSRATTWDTVASVTSSRATSWDTLAQVTATRATTWNVAGILAQITSSRATSWDTLARTTATRATTFDTLAQVSATRATTWDVLSRATTTRATTFDTLGQVTSTRATSWDALARVTATRATSWNVASSLTSVSSTRATTWRTLAAVSATRATAWDALARTTSTRATTWDVLTQVSPSTRATTWDVLARASATRSTVWDTLARVTTTRTTRWNVSSGVGILGGVAPPERTLIVASETRRLIVASETRRLVVPLEHRTQEA